MNAPRIALVGILAACAVGTLGCAEELSGPTPGVENPSPGTLPVDPGIICSEQHPEEGTAIAISGESFAPVGFDIPNDPKVALPDVSLRPTSSLDGGAASGSAVEYVGEAGAQNASLLEWTSQSAMAFRVTDGLEIAPGIYDVAIRNANDEEAVSAGALAVVDRPVVETIMPGLICVEQSARDVQVTGSNFLRNGDARPTFTIGEVEVGLGSLDDCADIAHEGLDAAVCNSATLTIDQGALPEGEHAVSVLNPETAACTSLPEEDGVVLNVIGPPVITSSEPAALCDADMTATPVTFTGDNFINVDGETFTVAIAGSEVTPDSVGGCEALDVTGMDVEVCTSFTVTIDPTTLDRGAVDVTVTNPESVGCETTTSEVFSIVGPPTVDSVMPTSICSEVTETITITGSGFGPNATVSAAGTMADMVMVNSDTEIVATFTDGLPEGTHDVTIDNGGGCSATATGVLQVDPTPIVFFVDPPVIYNGITTEVTIFSSGLEEDALTVEIVDSGGAVTELSGFRSPLRPNRILAEVPSGLPADTYEVRVTSQDGCTSIFNGELVITDSLTLNIDEIDPAFASPTTPTAITVKTTAPPDLVSTPRIYLNPNPAGAGVAATALEAIVFVDNETLTAVVPANLTPGAYDVIVVNPTGEVGVLNSGLTVTQTEPPVIDAVVPATLSNANAADHDVTIQGANFDPAGIEVTVTCEEPDGTVTTAPATVDAGSVTFDEAVATIPAPDYPKGTVCIVTVTNVAEGTSFDFSAISITNSAFNLEPWSATSAMNVARRGLGLESGRPTRTSRFLYAAGGDDGTAAGALTSVESANVGVFGDLSAWTMQREELPVARSMAGLVQIANFLYLVGGNDDTGTATDTVYRAEILNPLNAPDVTDVDATLGDGTNGLGEGLWMYRVSAIFPGADPSNPNGESLPGDVQFVDLPEIPDNAVLTITWEEIPGASGYRVYRSPQAGAAFDETELLAEVNGGQTTSYTDEGGDTMGTLPLREGATGTWHAVEALTTPRASAGVVATPVPGSDTQWALYAAGGTDDGGSFLSSIDYTTVTVNADGSQDIAAWAADGDALGSAKGELKGFVVPSSATAAVPPGETWVYFGPGRAGPNTYDDELSAFSVPANVTPTGLMGVNQLVSTDRGGYGAGASNGRLYIFGGASGGPADGGISAEMCTAVQGQCGTIPPDLKSGAWNSLGIAMSDPRVYMDVAQESAFYFVAGGWDGSAALDSVDQTVQ